MPSTKNKHQLEQINQNLKQSGQAFLVNYAGLTVNQQQELKSQALAKDSQFTVVKNTLLSLALKSLAPSLLDQLSDTLQGPTAILYTKDPVDGAKILANFQKDHSNLKIKAGFSLKTDTTPQDRFLSLPEIEKLSQLPTKEQLYANLLSQLNAPLTNLIQLIDSPIKYLVFALKAIKDQSTTN